MGPERTTLLLLPNFKNLMFDFNYYGREAGHIIYHYTNPLHRPCHYQDKVKNILSLTEY